MAKVKLYGHIEAYSSVDVFAFCFVSIGPFLAEIVQIPYLTWKF